MKVWQAGAVCGLVVAYLATALLPCAPATPLRFTAPPTVAKAAPAPAVVEAPAAECHEEMAGASSEENHHAELEVPHGSDSHEHQRSALASVATGGEPEPSPVGVRARCICGCDQPSGPTATSLAWHAPSMTQASWPAEPGVRPEPAVIFFTSRTLDTPSPVPLQS